MKIVLISPKFPNIWEPLGLASISSYCRWNVPNVDIEFYDESFDDINQIILAGANADYVGISATTTTYRQVLNIIKQIKQINSNVRVILGGWHATTSPRTILDSDITFQNSKNTLIDYVVVGEGEKAFVDIINGMHKPGMVLGTKMEFKDLLWPDRTIIKQERLLDLCESMCGIRIASFQSRRGCPMRCSFCGEKAMSGSTNTNEPAVRVRNAKDVLDEIEYVNNKYHIDKFKFVDPTWSAPNSAAIEFCEEKIRRGNKIPWSGMVHAAFINKSLMQLMKESSCDQIDVGVESGSQSILNKVSKGITIDRIKNVFRWAKEVGLKRRAFTIIGFPEETPNDIELTKQLIRDIQPDVLGTTVLTPFPGTSYYNHSTMKDVDFSECDEYSCSFWSTKYFSNQDLVRIQKEIYEEFKDIAVAHFKETCEKK